MEKKIEIIAVDFDGTLCSECYPAIGMPNLPLFALLKGERRQGKKVILWTCRCGDLLEEAVAWCRMFGLEFDAVNENVRNGIQKDLRGRLYRRQGVLAVDDEAGVGTVSGRLEKEDKKMKTVDMELILLCALMAAIGAFGLVTGVVLLFGIQFQECNAALLTGIVCGLWGILWGSLLIQNRNLVSKNV